MQNLIARAKQPRSWFFAAAIVIALTLALYTYGPVSRGEPAPKSISYTQFITDLEDAKIKSVELDPVMLIATAETKAGEKITTETPGLYGTEEITKAARSSNTSLEIIAPTEPGVMSSVLNLLGQMLPILIIVAVIIWFVRRGSSPKNLQIIEANRETNISFKDVAGVDEVIAELEDVREFLRDPERFRRLGAKIPKGVLLYGPPGTGKTLLARALASEAGVPFFSVSGSDFVEMFAGLGSARMRKLFDDVRKAAPAILFIDEIDAIGRHRGASSDGGARESDQTLNQLLVQMDGFEVQNTPVIVIAATNRLEMLDPALIRPGRFDRQVSISPPDRDGRLAIIKTHAQGKPLATDVDLPQLAATAAGMTGADLANMLNEAALNAARLGREEIAREDIEAAIMRVIAGPAKTGRRLSEREREIIAYHEAGHAIIGELVTGNHDVQKISIVPRGQSGGQTIATPTEDNLLISEEQLLHRIALLLAGRAAEEIVFSEVTSGAGHDLEQATNLALSAVNQLGFSRQAGLRVQTHASPLPEGLAAAREGEVEQLLESGYQMAAGFLTTNRVLLNELAELLLEKETVDRDEFLLLVARRAAATTTATALDA